MAAHEARDVVIFGAGGLGREVLWTLRHADVRVTDVTGISYRPHVLGFLDDNATNHGVDVSGVPIIGGSNWLDDQSGTLVVMAVGIPEVRKSVVKALRTRSVSFATCISPLAIVGDNSRLGEGSVLLPGAVVTVNAKLGRFVLLNPTTSVSHDCVIGDYTSIGPGASLAGNVYIGSGCDIGTNASVIPSVRVGKSTVVGAGACVVRDLPDNVTAVGVPARIVDQIS